MSFPLLNQGSCWVFQWYGASRILMFCEDVHLLLNVSDHTGSNSIVGAFVFSFREDEVRSPVWTKLGAAASHSFPSLMRRDTRVFFLPVRSSRCRISHK